ncbi:hypothetical protein HAX54_004529, partial [Datura stramonium]|nr:hypothetical protein [Datura stramonium]
SSLFRFNKRYNGPLVEVTIRHVVRNDKDQKLVKIFSKTKELDEKSLEGVTTHPNKSLDEIQKVFKITPVITGGNNDPLYHIMSHSICP